MIEEQRVGNPAGGEKPRIGIFGAQGTLRDGAWESYAGDLATVNALAEEGGSPITLPTYPIIVGLDIFDLLFDYGAFRYVFSTIWPLIRDLDGLVLTGGGDIDSRFFYRRVPHPRLQPPNIWRDCWEWVATLIAWIIFKSTFGICRGAQLMNVVLQGGLFQDDEEVQKGWERTMPARLQHRRGRPIYRNLISHPVCVVPGSVLAQAIRGREEHATPRYSINSVFTQHHNFIGAIRLPSSDIIGSLAPALTVAGYAPDGIIEAVADRDVRRSYWAVQFHPEHSKNEAWASSLFSFVVQSAKAHMGIDRMHYEVFREDICKWLWLRGRALHELSEEGVSSLGEERQTDALPRTMALASIRT